MIANQLKRQSDEVVRLREELDCKTACEGEIKTQLQQAQRKYADLESRMKEDLMMARIRDAENTQCVAELTQKISSLEYKVNKRRWGEIIKRTVMKIFKEALFIL